MRRKLDVSSHTMCLLTTNLVSLNSLSKSGNIAYTHIKESDEEENPRK